MTSFSSGMGVGDEFWRIDTFYLSGLSVTDIFETRDKRLEVPFLNNNHYEKFVLK